jgi:hypothetical protein
VIKFKCIYCGQRILAKDNGAGKKGKCPKCAHLLTVPESTKGRPAISPNKEPMPDRPDSPVVAWNEDDITDLCKENFGFLIPTYDKLSLFLMAVTLILLYLANPQMTGQTLNQMQDLACFLIEIMHLPLISTLILLSLAAIFYQLFLFDEKTDIKKKIMLDFAILINTGTGIFAGMYVIQNTVTSNWLLVFPIWNIVNGIIILLMFGFEIINEECISDRKATFVQIFFGLIAVIAIFLLCNYVFKLYWAITFSICIVYTTSFDRALQSVFPGLTNQKDEQSSES